MSYSIKYTHLVHFVHKGKESQTSFISLNPSPSLALMTKWLHQDGIFAIVTKIHTIPHY
jgi:anti-anti-sigma regulatory factor